MRWDGMGWEGRGGEEVRKAVSLTASSIPFLSSLTPNVFFFSPFLLWLCDSDLPARLLGCDGGLGGLVVLVVLGFFVSLGYVVISSVIRPAGGLISSIPR